MRSKVAIVIAIVTVLTACAHGGKSSKNIPLFRLPSGTNIPSLGLAFDASYDPATDGLVPGYKILFVAIANSSMDIIQLDRGTDRWSLVDARGNRHDAVIDLRSSSPEAYLRLSQPLREKLEYPLLIQVGESKVINLYFKENIRLDGFRSVRFTSRIMNKTFEIIAQD